MSEFWAALIAMLTRADAKGIEAAVDEDDNGHLYIMRAGSRYSEGHLEIELHSDGTWEAFLMDDTAQPPGAKVFDFREEATARVAYLEQENARLTSDLIRREGEKENLVKLQQNPGWVIKSNGG